MPRKSNVWSYFTKYSDEAKCNTCDKTLKCAGSSTSGLAFHKKNVHHIDLNEDVGAGAKRQKTLNFFIRKLSMVEEVSKMASVDGFSFQRIANSAFVQESFKKRKHEYDIPPPTCPNTAKNMVISFYEEKKRELAKLFKEKCTNGQRFSLTLDEYTSIQNKRFMNINVHAENEHWSLGMLLIRGSLNSAKCEEMVNARLKEFDLDMNEHIMAFTTDGASVMVKFGREISPDHQQCLAHGIYLAVVDVLYNKNVIDEEDEIGQETSEDDIHKDCAEDYIHSFALTDDYLGLIKKVRKVCKMFRKSPLKNDILQGIVKSEHGNELQLILDVKTRWNSLLDMCERFYKMKSCIIQALEICCNEEFSEKDWNILKSLCHTLRPVEIVLTSLCSEDANLLKADKSMMLLLSKLAKQDSLLSRQMHLSLKQQYEKRRVHNTVALLKYLNDPKARNELMSDTFKMLSPGSLKKYATSVYTRLFHELDPEPHTGMGSTQETPDQSNVNEYDDDEEEEDFRKSLHQVKSFIFNVESEFAIYETQKKRTENLDRLYDALKTIKPTSCEAEQAFSSAGFFITKIRSSLSPATINALCFLKCYFLNKHNKQN